MHQHPSEKEAIMTPQEKALDKAISIAYKALAKKLTETTSVELQSDISEQMSTLLSQRVKLSRRALSKESVAFKSAITALEDLTTDAKEAKKDVDKIEQLIKKTSKTVDKLTQFISGLAKATAIA